MAAKINKTQLSNEVTTLVQSIITANSDMFKKGNDEKFAEILLPALFELIGPKTGGGVSDKVNSEGLVYCNYFDSYMEADDFNKKTNGKFKANCITAEKILRKLKNIRSAVERGATARLRAKEITQAKWFEIMEALDKFTSRKFQDVSEIIWNDTTDLEDSEGDLED